MGPQQTVPYDHVAGTVKWSVHLDLTTEETKLRAYIYSPVTVADLDGDGELEVIVGTSMGFLYVLSGKHGKLRDGFPVQLNEIQAQVPPTSYLPPPTSHLLPPTADTRGPAICTRRSSLRTSTVTDRSS